MPYLLVIVAISCFGLGVYTSDTLGSAIKIAMILMALYAAHNLMQEVA